MFKNRYATLDLVLVFENWYSYLYPLSLFSSWLHYHVGSIYWAEANINNYFIFTSPSVLSWFWFTWSGKLSAWLFFTALISVWFISFKQSHLIWETFWYKQVTLSVYFYLLPNSALLLSGNRGQQYAYVANNTFYVRPGVPFVRKRMHGKMTLKNNKIIKIEK